MYGTRSKFFYLGGFVIWSRFRVFVYKILYGEIYLGIRLEAFSLFEYRYSGTLFESRSKGIVVRSVSSREAVVVVWFVSRLRRDRSEIFEGS